MTGDTLPLLLLLFVVDIEATPTYNRTMSRGSLILRRSPFPRPPLIVHAAAEAEHPSSRSFIRPLLHPIAIYSILLTTVGCFIHLQNPPALLLRQMTEFGSPVPIAISIIGIPGKCIHSDKYTTTCAVT